MTITIIENIRNFIAKDRLKEAIEVFRVNCKEYTSELILQSNKYSNLQAQIRDGVISREQSNLERSRLCKALLELLNEIDVEKNSPKNINYPITDELKDVLALAELISRRKEKEKTSTRDFFTALNTIKPNSIIDIINELNIVKALPDEIDRELLDLPRSFSNNRTLSGCLTESLTELNKVSDKSNSITSADMFIDVSKYGKGKSVAKLRKKGVGISEINNYVEEHNVSIKGRTE